MHLTNGKKPAQFLKNIDCMILDMDGVITSEENYWNAAALAVNELFTSKRYFGQSDIKVELTKEEVKEIRDKVFSNDKLIMLLKNSGVNTNWDLAFITICVVLILEDVKCINFNKEETNKEEINIEKVEPDYREVYKYIKDLDLEGFGIFEFIEQRLSKVIDAEEEFFIRSGAFWNICQKVFQEWYLGEELYEKVFNELPKESGKDGLIHSEEALMPLDEIENVLKVLYDANIRLGIATGRPYIEIEPHLNKWGIKKYFNDDSFVTYDDVIGAEKILEKNIEKYPELTTHVAKPHPYVFLKAIYGKQYDDIELLKGRYDKKLIKSSIIVGDAGADIIPAKDIGCKFVAVLTGVSGEAAEDYFKEAKAEYILKDIRELIE